MTNVLLDLVNGSLVDLNWNVNAECYTCRWSGWSLHHLLLFAGGEAGPYTMYCSFWWSGWSLHPVLFLACVQADPCALYCYLQVVRLILTPCTIPSMCSYPYSLFSLLDADSNSDSEPYGYIVLCRTCVHWLKFRFRSRSQMGTVPILGTDLCPYYLTFQ